LLPVSCYFPANERASTDLVDRRGLASFAGVSRKYS